MEITAVEHLNPKHHGAWVLAESKIKAASEDGDDLLELIGTSACQLLKVPSSVGKLSMLRLLDLRDNKLRHFPEAVLALPALRCLNLEGNLLTTLPPAIGQMARLADLDLSRNAFELVDGETSPLAAVLPALFAMQWLTRIVLQKNAIGSGWQQHLLKMGSQHMVTVLVAGCTEPANGGGHRGLFVRDC